jgi:AcrR family transcriptional regulator
VLAKSWFSRFCILDFILQCVLHVTLCLVESNGGRRESFHELRKSRTRLSILGAAESLFASPGYSAATMEQIATAAGITRPTVYLHFDSKRDVALGIIERLRKRSLEVASIGAELSTLDAGGVADLAARWIGFYRENLPAIRVLYQLTAIEPGLDRLALSDIYELAERMLGPGAMLDPLVRREAACLVTMMYQLLDRCCYVWLVEDWDLDEDRLLEHLTGAWNSYFVPRLRALLQPVGPAPSTLLLGHGGD